MKRLILLIFLLMFSITVFTAPVKTLSSTVELNTIFKCHTDYSVMIEFPRGTEIDEAIFQNDQWKVEKEFNLVLVQPKYHDSNNGTLLIKVKGYREIKLRFQTTEEEKKLIHTYVLEKDALTPETEILFIPKVKDTEVVENLSIDQSPAQMMKKRIVKSQILKRNVPAAETGIEQSPKKEEVENKKNEQRFSLSGGTSSFHDSSFSVQGEYVGAFKFENIFTQIAGLIDYNKYIKRYGFSVGGGFIQKNIGGYLFLDSIFYGIEDFKTSWHMQVRPTFRLTLDKVQLTTFVAIPITKDVYTEVNVTDNGEVLGIYNKALLHAGFQARAYFNNVYSEIKALVASEGVYSVSVRIGYTLFKDLVVIAEYIHGSAGEHEFIQGVNKSSTIRISGSYFFGTKSPVADRIRKDLIVDPSYPIVVQVKKTPEASDVSINLVANPTEGFALLAVDFTATPYGFNGTVNYKWKYTPSNSGETNSPVSNFTYTTPGTYQAYVEGTDENGNYAKSNEVTIIVKVNTDPDARYTIKATCSEGGYIQPTGETTAKSGNTISISFGANDGYGVTKVTVDGSEITAHSSPFVFKNIQSNHTIHVEYTKGAVTQYTIESSVKSGSGTISPLGTTTVNEGSSQSYSISPASGWSIVRVLVDGESVGAPTTFVFENIKASHTIECEFSETAPTLYEINATSGPNGSISPDGKISVVQNDSITFTLTPDPGYEIDVLTVDGSSTSPNEGSDKFKFSNVTANHTINITFKRIILHVTTSVTAGEGTITESSDVFWGDDFTVTASPVESNQVKDLVVNGGSVGQVSEITLNQIKTDQVVSVEFEIKKFTITASVRNNQWGTISPGTVEVEWGTDKNFTFSPESNKEVRRYWVNGTLQTKANSHDFSDVRADKTIEVEFDWIYYDVKVELVKVGDWDCDGTVDPGEGWHSYKAGTDPVFECNVDGVTKIDGTYLNGNKQGTQSSYKIWDINKDHVIRFEIRRKLSEVSIEIKAVGCTYPGSVTCDRTGGSQSGGGTQKYYVPVQMPVTFYFNYAYPYPEHIDHYELTTENQNIINPLPDQWTIANPQDGDRLHVKCVLKSGY